MVHVILISPPNNSCCIPPGLPFISFLKVLMDESIEQQKRVASLTAQLELSRQSSASADLNSYLQQLEQQRAAEYIARIRRFYSGYSAADDLFTWSLEVATLRILADSAYNSPQRVVEVIQRLDDVRWEIV